jgi:hypothetical protein
VGLVEGGGVRECGVGYHGPEFAGTGVEVEVGVGRVEIDCYSLVGFSF